MRKNQRSFSFFFQILFFSLFQVLFLLAISSLFFLLFGQDMPKTKKADAAEPRKEITVLLDAGHGGVDSGAVSVLGHEEKNINLAVTKKLGEFLTEAGIRVLYTRTEDEMLTSDKTTSRKLGDLLARVTLSQENENATFISIHMNTLPIEKYKGLQVFYSENHPTSKVLALQIQNDVKKHLQPENERTVKNAKSSIYVLDRITSPAVLVECGFLSNYEEASLLADEDYQCKLAFTLSRSLVSYLMQKETDL